MSNASSERWRIRLLVINLVLLGLCLSGLVGAIVLYRLYIVLRPVSVAEVTSTARPTFTPSLTATFTSSPTITRTPLPSLTPTITETPTPLPSETATPTSTNFPTLTPAPPLAQADAYQLAEWSPEQAAYMAQLMGSYPNAALAASADSKDRVAYYQSFQYRVLALREALLQFPGEPQAAEWRWMLAYDLAQMGSAEAGTRYAQLLASGLNSGETEVPYLYLWFAEHEPRLSFYMVELEPPEGFTGSYMVELRGEGGSAFIWLLQATNSYQTYPLLTYFDFVDKTQANWVVENFTGSNGRSPEIAVYASALADQFTVDPPRVFSLSKMPPLKLPFFPDQAIFRMGIEFTNRWKVSTLPGKAAGLTFESTVFPACPVDVRLDYGWSEVNFALQRQVFEVQPNEKTLAYCALLVDHAAAVWGPEAAISVMEALLPFWPPAADAQGQPYPLDARDEWLYRLGVYRALAGDTDVAIDYMNQVSTQPGVPDSRWIEPAHDFLMAYQSQADVYRACQAAPLCDPVYALDYLVEHLPEGQDAFEYLKQAGVNPNSSGYFDFDADGETERWFTTRHHPRDRSEFWILARYRDGVKALRVGNVDAVPPSIEYLDAAYIADDGLTLLPAVFLEGTLAFNMQRLPGTQAPYLKAAPLRKEYPSKFFIPLENAQQRLFAGASPEAVKNELINLARFPGLLCKPTWTCDSYYYLLGLSSELAGDEQTAVKAYHRLWLDYSLSPYTAMARLKLVGAVPAATPTASPVPAGQATATLTPTRTQIPTVTGTRITTVTATSTPTVSGTPPTATPTVTGTRGTATVTLTPTTPSATTPVGATATETYPPPSATETYPPP